MRARSAVFTPRSGSCRGAGFCVARIGSMSRPERRAMVVRDHPTLSQSRQRRLLSIGRSSLYYEPKGESAETLALMRRIDELFLKYPCLRRSSDGASPAPRGRADRAAPGRLSDAPDGLQAIYRAPRTGDPHPDHRVYPYLLRGLASERPNHVWCANITYSTTILGRLRAGQGCKAQQHGSCADKEPTRPCGMWAGARPAGKRWQRVRAYRAS